MKIYFLGSVVNNHTFDSIVRGSAVKPSNSVQNYSEMLIKGLVKTGVDLECHTIPAVSAYPGGNLLFWGRRKEILNNGFPVVWLPAINIQGLKQFTISVSAFFSILNWLIRNRAVADKTVFTYSVYPPFAQPMQFLCRLFSCKTTVIIADLPEYLYNLRKQKGLAYRFKAGFTKKIVKLQGGFDNYILLTEQMIARLGLAQKPHIVVEGFSDKDIFEGITSKGENKAKTVCYTGALNDSFGIRRLLDAFMAIEGEDYNLWLYGGGDLEGYVRQCAAKDKRITYFGKVDRVDLLTAQKSADLLISTKPAEQDHGNYAFPSKIMEYMTSGTAVLSTVVGGIPKEYFDYIYAIEDESTSKMADRIKEILDKPKNELAQKGELARQFVATKKNCYVQTEKIVSFIRQSF